MSDQSESDKKADLDRVQAAVNTLIEHFDTVQIFVTRQEAYKLGGAVNVQLGHGNWFARYGQIKIWSMKEEEWTRCEARGGREL